MVAWQFTVKTLCLHDLGFCDTDSQIRDTLSTTTLFQRFNLKYKALLDVECQYWKVFLAGHMTFN